MTDSEQYARWVLDPLNVQQTGKPIKQAAERFLNDLKRTDIRFDEDEGNKIVAFLQNHCVHTEGDWVGQPIVLELWQRFIFQQVYGWFKVSDGRRRFNKVYIQVSKKNGKSTVCAGLGDFHMLADDRVKTPRVFTAANNEEQARICVHMAGKIIEDSPDLADLIGDHTRGRDPDKPIQIMKIQGDIYRVVHHGKNGFIKTLSKEADDKKAKTAGGKHGINASLGIVDEFGMSPDHGASKTIETSMASRKEYLMFYITTAGYNMDGPCYKELRKLGLDVLNGTVKRDNYLPIIYEIDPPLDDKGKPKEITAEWLKKNEWSWKQSNPNLDISVNREFLRDMIDDAETKGGTTEVDVKTLNFNMWVNSAQTFIPAQVWNKNAHGLTLADLEGEFCYGGIEIVSGKQLNSFCFIFPNVQGHVVILPIFWMPDECPDKTDDADKWVKEGFITSFLGNVSDNDKVYDLITEYISKFEFHSFAYKSALENSDIVQALIKNDIVGNPISHGYQGIGTPTLMWEEMITAGACEHFGNPVLAWMNGNCLAKRKENDVRLEKVGSQVVGIYAAINALAQWKTVEANEEEEGGVDYI